MNGQLGGIGTPFSGRVKNKWAAFVLGEGTILKPIVKGQPNKKGAVKTKGVRREGL